MRTFNFLISDDRYAVPTLAIVMVNDASRAIELARKRLNDSPHHLAIEIHEGDEQVARLDRDGADS